MYIYIYICLCFLFLPSSRTWQTTENRERSFDKNVERWSFHWIATPISLGSNAFVERHETKEADLDSKLRYRSAGNAPFAAQSAPNDVRILSWLGAFGGAGLVWWPPSRILRPCRRTPQSLDTDVTPGNTGNRRSCWIRSHLKFRRLKLLLCGK